ncbi:MAG: PASTA domain-containing protein [Spirochaetes bacterium]|nr:PASTA domain-containing protein [Spirochaetota bacterium]
MKNFIRSNRKILALIVLYFSIFIAASLLIIIIRIKPAKEVKVPSVVGENFLNVYNQIVRRELKPEIKFYDVMDIDDGMILSQFPPAGAPAKAGSRLRITVSRNNLKVDMPSLTGSELAIAKNKLKNLHIGEKTVSLGTGTVTYIPSKDVSEQVVIMQNPRAGEKVKPDQKVNLLVSLGDIETLNVMPDLKGQSVDLANDFLNASMISLVQKVIKADRKESGGLVADQSIPAGGKLEKGSTVTLTVSYYELSDHFYSGYEKIVMSVPKGGEEGVYEVAVSDDVTERICFSGKKKGGDEIEFVFFRTGNAKVVLMKDKKEIKKTTVNVDSFE